MINHDPNRQVRGTVTKLETLPQTNHMSHPDPDPDRDPVQVRGTVTKLETLPQANHISHLDPDQDPVQVRGTVTNLDMLLQANHINHQDPDRDHVQIRDPDSNLKFQGHHHGEGHYSQGYLSHLHQSVILLNNLCKGRKTRPRK